MKLYPGHQDTHTHTYTHVPPHTVHTDVYTHSFTVWNLLQRQSKWFMSQPTYTISLWNREAAFFKFCASSCIAIRPLRHTKHIFSSMESLRNVAVLLLTRPQIPKQGREHCCTLALNKMHKIKVGTINQGRYWPLIERWDTGLPLQKSPFSLFALCLQTYSHHTKTFIECVSVCSFDGGSDSLVHTSSGLSMSPR